jgi:Domain of unknown function (DUF4169)
MRFARSDDGTGDNMSEVVNLRRVRKRQAVAKAELQAAANRLAYGVSKNVRNKSETERALAESRLEGHRRSERGDAP